MLDYTDDLQYSAVRLVQKNLLIENIAYVKYREFIGKAMSVLYEFLLNSQFFHISKYIQRFNHIYLDEYSVW